MAVIYPQIVELFIRPVKIQSHIDIFPIFVLLFYLIKRRVRFYYMSLPFSTFPDPNDPDYVYFTTFSPSPLFLLQ